MGKRVNMGNVGNVGERLTYGTALRVYPCTALRVTLLWLFDHLLSV